MSATKSGANSLDAIRSAGIELGAVAWDDGGGALVAHWRDGAELGALTRAASAVAGRLTALCQTRTGAESVASSLSPELADVAMLWATSVAHRDELVLSPMVTAISAARPALRRHAARERLLHGPLWDALHCLPGAWGDDRDHLVTHRIRQLVWEAGARGLTLPAVGRWAWATPSVIRTLIIEPAHGHLGDRVLAARALAMLADGFSEDGSPSLARLVVAAARPLFEHPDPAVWTAAARGLGRMTIESQSARVLIFRAASSKRSDLRRRGAAALASLPFSVGAESWIQKRLDQILSPAGQREDPWQLAALAVATPHLARERPDLWYELCAIALGSPTFELGWTLAQGLAMMSRHNAGYGWIADELRIAEQLRERLAARSTDAITDVARQADALVYLDRALGKTPEIALCLDLFDARIHADVEHRSAPEPPLPGVAFETAFADADNVDMAIAGRAQLALRSATRAQAMHLSELVLGLDTRTADTDAMAMRCSAYLAADVCSYGLRATLVGALTDLVNAGSVELPGTGHGNASARALRSLAASRWLLALADPDASRVAQVRREVQRFRKPLEDLFDACLAPRAALAERRDDVTVPPVIAAWWVLCAGPAGTLASIERDHGQALRVAVAELERALAGGAFASVSIWGAAATAALTALDASDTVMFDAFARLLHVLGLIERSPNPPQAEATRLLASLAIVARAFVAIGHDLDDALSPAAAIDHVLARSEDGPGLEWLARTAYTSSDLSQVKAPREWASELGPALRAIVLPITLMLEARSRGDTTFVACPGAKLGPFVMVRRVGRGGMGEVWRADRRRQPVALKIPRAQFAEEDRVALAEALHAEADHLMGFSFANVAVFIDGGVIDGVPFLATSFVRGPTLEEHLISDPRADAAGVHFPLVRKIVDDVCVGLQNLHRHHVVHRDLKPGNIMLRMSGTEADPIRTISEDPNGDEITDAVLIDFGIAHRLNGSGGGFTLGYAAPEAIDELDADTPPIVGPAADVYALGATLFHVLTRRSLVGQRGQIAALLWHRETEPFDDPDVAAAAAKLAPKVRDTLAGALRLDPARRITVAQFRAGICKP